MLLASSYSLYNTKQNDTIQKLDTETDLSDWAIL
jgi:hypothetical protein